MMAPDPESRPSIEEILMHPNLAVYMERSSVRNNLFNVSRTNSQPMDYIL